MLLFRDHSEIDSLGNTLYTVYEAKVFAERVPSVGDNTNITIFYADGEWHKPTLEQEKLIRNKMSKYFPKPVLGKVFDEKELAEILKKDAE